MRVTVPGHGPSNARIALVGEQPGKIESLQGRPFVGPAGRVLDECLTSAGIIRSELYMTNVIKTLEKPLESYIVKPSKGDPQWTAEGLEYVACLREELKALRPNVVCAIGNVALWALGSRWGITKWRGSVLSSTLIEGLKFVGCIHPATVLPDKGQYLNKHLITNDLLRVRLESGSLEINLIPRELVIKPSFHEVLAYLEATREEGLAGQVIDFDIEVVNEQVSCIAFARRFNLAMSVPFTNGPVDYFDPDQEAQIWLAIASILEDPRIAKRGQNLAFDCQFLLHTPGIRVRGEIHDTMIAQRISCTDYPIGLDFIASVHTDIPYYKDEGKKWFKFGGAMSQFWQYNAMDTITTAAAHPKQMEDLITQKNVEVYDRTRRIVPPLVYMMERGVLVDLEGMISERKRVEARQAQLEAELEALIKRPVTTFKNGKDVKFYNAPKQVANYFYREKGIKPYTKRNAKGQSVPTTDDDAIKRIVRLGFYEAKLVQTLRSLSTKTLGTYLDPSKVSKDGRYRPSYKPVGARTGRLSSAENIFDEGGNLQNWPHKLLRFLLADPGGVFYSFDESQIENRIVAYVGRVIEMIRCFEDGIDVHALVGANIANRATGSQFNWKDIKAQDKADVFCPIGDGSKTWRYYGKRTGHASNYDMGVNTFALQNELKQNDAKFLLESYHQLFPEIRANYQSMIRAMLMQNRTVTNLYGRNRTFMGEWGDDMFKAAYAQLPQSTVADHINEHGLSHIYYDQENYGQVELVNQVHDSVGFWIPLSAGWLEHARILQRIRNNLERPLSWHGRSFTVPVDLTMGFNLCKDPVFDDIDLSPEDKAAGKKGKMISNAAEFKSKDIPTDLAIFAHKLETAWNEINKSCNRQP